MHKDVKQLVAKAETIGWTCDGVLDGRGHYTLVHENGTRYPIAATPSDPRSGLNALANLERLAGQKTARIIRNRSRKKVEFYEDNSAARAKSAARITREAEKKARQEARTAALIKRDRELGDIRKLMGGGR